MYEGMVGKLQYGCLGGVVETLLLDVLLNIVVHGFAIWRLKKEVDMLFLYIRYIF
jgi:hypothetical protein